MWPCHASLSKETVFAHIRHIMFFSILKRLWKKLMQNLGGSEQIFDLSLQDSHFCNFFFWKHVFGAKDIFWNKKIWFKNSFKGFLTLSKKSLAREFLLYPVSGEIKEPFLTILVEKNSKKLFWFSKCSNLKSTRYVGFVSKRYTKNKITPLVISHYRYFRLQK